MAKIRNKNDGKLLNAFYIAFAVMLALATFWSGAPVVLLIAALICIPAWNIIDGFLDSDGFIFKDFSSNLWNHLKSKFDSNRHTNQHLVTPHSYQWATKLREIKRLFVRKNNSETLSQFLTRKGPSKFSIAHTLFDHLLLGGIATGTMISLGMWVHKHAATVSFSHGMSGLMNTLPHALGIMVGPVCGALFAICMAWYCVESCIKLHKARTSNKNNGTNEDQKIPTGKLWVNVAAQLAATLGATTLAAAAMISIAQPHALIAMAAIISTVGVALTITAAVIKLVQLVWPEQKEKIECFDQNDVSWEDIASDGDELGKRSDLTSDSDPESIHGNGEDPRYVNYVPWMQTTLSSSRLRSKTIVSSQSYYDAQQGSGGHVSEESSPSI